MAWILMATAIITTFFGGYSFLIWIIKETKDVKETTEFKNIVVECGVSKAKQINIISPSEQTSERVNSITLKESNIDYTKTVCEGKCLLLYDTKGYSYLCLGDKHYLESTYKEVEKLAVASDCVYDF